MFNNIIYFFFGHFIDAYYRKKVKKLVDDKYFLEDRAMSPLEKALRLMYVNAAPKSVQDELAKKYGKKLIPYLPTSLRYEYLEKYEASKVSRREHFVHPTPTNDPMQRYMNDRNQVTSSHSSNASDIQHMQNITNMHIATQATLQNDDYMGSHSHHCSGRTETPTPSWSNHRHHDSGNDSSTSMSSGSDSSTGGCD